MKPQQHNQHQLSEEENIADKLGHTLATNKIRKGALPGLDKVYVSKDDPNKERSKKIVQKVAKNLNSKYPLNLIGGQLDEETTLFLTLLLSEEIKSNIDYTLHPDAKELFYIYYNNPNIPFIEYDANLMVGDKNVKAKGGVNPLRNLTLRRSGSFVYDKQNNKIFLRNEKMLMDPRTAVALKSFLDQFPEVRNASLSIENTDPESWTKTYKDYGPVSKLLNNAKTIKGKFRKERYSDKTEYETFKTKVLQPVTQIPWYHATRYSNWNSIKSSGIKPSLEAKKEQGEGWTQLNFNLKNVVYLTSDPSYAMQIADTLAGRFEERAVVIEIQGAALTDLSKLAIDEDALLDDYDGSISYGNVDTEVPNFLTSVLSWRGSIGYAGTIPTRYLSIYGYSDPEKQEDKQMNNESKNLKAFIKQSVKKIFEELQKEEELNEFSAVGGGAVVGYTLPLGMSTKPGHKKLKKKK